MIEIRKMREKEKERTTKRERDRQRQRETERQRVEKREYSKLASSPSCFRRLDLSYSEMKKLRLVWIVISISGLNQKRRRWEEEAMSPLDRH